MHLSMSPALSLLSEKRAYDIMEILKRLYWDLAAKHGRRAYIEQFIRNFPLQFGLILRERWYRRLFKKAGTRINIMPGTYIIHPEKVECRDNIFFGINNYIQAAGGLIMGSDVVLGPYVKIWTQNHLYQDFDNPVWQQGYEYKPVVIGNDVWLGASVFVMPGAKIGDKCIVSANSVLGGKEYPEGSILAGYPARKIGVRKP